MNNYHLHSGGCDGADMTWELLGLDYGVKPYGYSFPNHTQYSTNQVVLSNSELKEGWEHILEAEKSLKRNIHNLKSTYVRSLQCRNWFQVKNSDAVFAVEWLENNKRTKVKGGTGWAVQMAIDENKPIYLFEQNEDSWFIYDYIREEFLQYYDIPTLTKHFAGIGTRNMMDNGIRAINDVYEHNLKNHV